MIAPWLKTVVGAAVIVMATIAVRAEDQPTFVKNWLAELRENCSNKILKTRKGYLQRRDVNGDGIKDYILDNGFVECPGELTSFCGTGGCDTTIFASKAGTYVKAFEGMLRDVDYKLVKGRPAMVVSTHGSGCGKVGAESCTSTLFWNGTSFTSR